MLLFPKFHLITLQVNSSGKLGSWSYRVPDSQTSGPALSWRVWFQSQPPAWIALLATYSHSERLTPTHLPVRDQRRREGIRSN